MGEDGAVDGRRLMFGVIESWWRSKDQQEQYELRRQLSRDGVMNGENHKEGVQDSGHGCGKPLGMAKSDISKDIGGGAGSGVAGAMMGELSSALGSGGPGGKSSFRSIASHFGSLASFYSQNCLSRRLSPSKLFKYRGRWRLADNIHIPEFFRDSERLSHAADLNRSMY